MSVIYIENVSDRISLSVNITGIFTKNISE